MTALHQAAKMALDALETGYFQGTQDAITALREALAAPQPEPVALCDALRWSGAKESHGTMMFSPDQLRKFYEFASRAAPAGMVMPRQVAKELVRLADIMRDCGRLVSTSGAAETTMRNAAAMIATAPAPADWGTPHDVSGAPWPDAPAPAVRCPTCNGDDMQAPCAYPEGGQPGCLRDKRLSAAPAVPDVEKLLDEWAEAAGQTWYHCGASRGIETGRGVSRHDLRQLVTAALPAAPAVREPLTDEQIIAIRKDTPLFTSGVPWENSLAFARAIERAHGIGGGGNG